MPAVGVFCPNYAICLLNVLVTRNVLGKPGKNNKHYFMPQVFRMFLYFHKMLRDSAFNCLSAIMYVSFMPLSLVFMHRRHVCSAVHPLAQWRLVA